MGKKLKRNLKIALNVLYAKKEKTYTEYNLKHNLNREKQIILLMIPIGERWHYLAVTKLSALLRGITSKNNGDFYCLNCLNSFRTKNKLESHKKYVKIKIFVTLKCLLKTLKCLEFNQYQKSYKASCIIYADLECLIERLLNVNIILKIHPQQN